METLGSFLESTDPEPAESKALDGARDLVRAADDLRAKGYFRVGLTLYTKSLALGQTDEARFGAGVCLGKLGRFEDAYRMLAPLFAHGGRGEGLPYWAYVLERNGELDEALSAYDRAIASLVGGDPWAHGHRAYCLEKLGRAAAARHAYAAVLRRFPGDTWTRKRFALFLHRRGHSARAVELLAAGLALAKDPVLAAINRLEMAVIMGDEASARESCAAIRRSPDAAAAHHVLVDVIEWASGVSLYSGTAEFGVVLHRAETLPTPIHRDFDDLEGVVRRRRGDLEHWNALVSSLMK